MCLFFSPILNSKYFIKKHIFLKKNIYIYICNKFRLIINEYKVKYKMWDTEFVFVELMDYFSKFLIPL